MPDATTAHTHTTIKVTAEVRDRLKVLAESDGLTLGAEISRLIGLAERRSRMEGIGEDMKAMAPEDLASYREEIEFWDAVVDA